MINHLPYLAAFNRTLQRCVGSALRPGGLSLTRKAIGHLQLMPRAAVLDVGCGPGETMALLKDCGFLPFGLDPYFPFVKEAAAYGSCLQGSAGSIALRSKSMSAVFCECVLSVVPDRGAALAQMHRVLQAGGYLVLADIYTVLDAPPGQLSTFPVQRAENPAAAEASHNSNAATVPQHNPPRLEERGMLLPELEALLALSGFKVELREDYASPHAQSSILEAAPCPTVEEFYEIWLAAGHSASPQDMQEAERLSQHRPRCGYVLYIARAV